MNCALALSENLAGLPASCQDGFPALSVRLADVFGGTDESGLAEVTRQATSENEFQIRRGLQEIEIVLAPFTNVNCFADLQGNHLPLRSLTCLATGSGVLASLNTFNPLS